MFKKYVKQIWIEVLRHFSVSDYNNIRNNALITITQPW